MVFEQPSRSGIDHRIIAAVDHVGFYESIVYF
jgi:hypothetical protein